MSGYQQGAAWSFGSAAFVNSPGPEAVLCASSLHTRHGVSQPPPPQQVLHVDLSHPCWQLWPSPCHQSHSHWCAMFPEVAGSDLPFP